MERDLNPENNIKLSKEGREMDGLCQTSLFLNWRLICLINQLHQNRRRTVYTIGPHMNLELCLEHSHDVIMGYFLIFLVNPS